MVSYVGEGVAAAGYALAGARVYTPVPEPGATWDAVSQARTGSHLVLIDQRFARLIGERIDQLVLTAPSPPVMVVPGMQRDEALGGAAVQAACRALGLA